MRQAKKLAAAKQKSIIIGIAVACLVTAAVGFGIATLANNQKTDYTNKLHTTSDQLTQALGADAKTLQQLAKKPDGKKLYTILDALQAKTTGAKASLPGLPQLVGVSLVSEKEQRNHAQLQEQIDTFLRVLGEVSSLNRYKTDVYTALQPVLNQKATNAAQLKKLAAKWKTANERLKTITPPANAGDAHKKLTQLTDSIHATIAKLPALHSKDDHAGFVAAQKVLTGKITSLDEVAHLYQTLTKDSQKALTTHVTRLHDALGL